MGIQYLLIFLVIGTAWAQNSQEVADILSKLPKDLQGQVDEKEIGAIQNKSKQAFKEKCEKNGGPDAYLGVEAAYTNVVSCMQSLVNEKVLREEIENHRNDGELDTVFKKYCSKSPQFKGCFKNMTEAVGPCFSENEKVDLKIINNITEQLAEFICFKDGDRIALFIAEGGPECFKEKQEQIQDCLKKTFGEYQMGKEGFSVDNLPEISFKEKQCSDLTELQRCMVTSLETCEQSNSANIVDALFKFVRKATPCKQYVIANHEKHSKSDEGNARAQKGNNAASGLAATSATVLLAVMTATLY